MSNSLDPDQARRLVGPDLGQNVCKGYQQTTVKIIQPIIMGIYLSKALTFMIFFLYKQKMLFYQGDGYLWPHCYMNNIHLTSQFHINHLMSQHTAFEQSFFIL